MYSALNNLQWLIWSKTEFNQTAHRPVSIPTLMSAVCIFILPAADWSGAACGVMVIIVGNGHGDTSSNPGRD